MKIAVAQINTTVGDFAGNAARIRTAIDRARTAGAHLVVAPEMALSGYPPEDLLLRNDFCDQCDRELLDLATYAPGIAVVVGHPHREGRTRYNAASVLRGGKIEAIYFKQRLPNYNVFDEKRYFATGGGACLFEVAGASDRGHDLRGPVVCRARRPGEGSGRRTPALDQRLAVPSQQAGRALPGHGGAREGDGPAARLRPLGRRAGRAGLRRRLVRLSRGRLAGLPGGDLPRKRGHPRLRGRSRFRADRPAAHRGRDDLPGAGHGRSRLRRQEPLPRGARRALRRYRLRARGGHLRRRARAGSRARRDDALRLHGLDEHRGLARNGEADGARVPRDRDPAHLRGLPCAARPGVRRPIRGLPPRKTSRRERAERS